MSWGQARFIEQTLAKGHQRGNKRVIASLTTLPDRIHNLEPTIGCLLSQTRPPDEIIVAVPENSIRQERSYSIPQYLSQFPALRILRSKTDWGPATKFIPVLATHLRLICIITNNCQMRLFVFAAGRCREIFTGSCQNFFSATEFASQNALR